MPLLGRNKLQLTAYEQASVLRQDALAGFRTAYDTLSQSNALLAEDAEQQRLAGIEYRKQLEAAIKEAENRQAAAKTLAASNQTSIDLLAGILGK